MGQMGTGIQCRFDKSAAGGWEGGDEIVGLASYPDSIQVPRPATKFHTLRPIL
jgi:hypothetical protein